jgi:ABC-type dipeptide/oligopeptide/nickel transport system permease subunit
MEIVIVVLIVAVSVGGLLLGYIKGRVDELKKRLRELK